MSKLGFRYVRPSTIRQVVEALQTPKARIIAGGTDLMIELKEQEEQDCLLVDVTAIPEMTEIRLTDNTIEIGAAVSFTDISLHPVIRKEFSALAQAASLVGSPQIRNRGTIGGNLATGSSAGDSLCPLTAFGADLVLVSPAGEETVNIADFWHSENRKNLSTRVLLSKVVLRRNNPSVNSVFIKLGRRESLAISRLSLTLALRIEESGEIQGARAAIGSAGRHAYRVPEAEAILNGNVSNPEVFLGFEKAMSCAVVKMLGARATARYKGQAIQALCNQALKQLA